MAAEERALGRGKVALKAPNLTQHSVAGENANVHAEKEFKDVMGMVRVLAPGDLELSHHEHLCADRSPPLRL